MTLATPAATTPIQPPRLLLPTAAERQVDEQLIGGKAASLVALLDAGLPVPAFLCITTAVFDDLLASMPAELRTALEHPPSNYEEMCELAEQACAHVRQAESLTADLDALEELLTSTFAPGAVFAVRSSSVGEDSAAHSFAGQFATFLGVDIDGVAAHVLDCFASAFAANALTYRRVRDVDLAATRMGVVVQLMVDSASSGVVFTMDPRTGRTDRVLITAGFGLGEGVVDGRVDTDTYVLDPTGAVLNRSIRVKQTQVVRNLERPGTTQVVDVPGADAARPVLTDELIAELAAHAVGLARTRARAQDIEWAVDQAGRLHILQARPVTTVGHGRHLVFDNSNLVESYPGLTAPLTFSLMRRAYEVNFLGLVKAFGAPDAMVQADREVYANLVGLLDGRMYYNLSNWYRMFTQLPGMERALPAFERAMGFTPERVTPQRLGFGARLRWLPLQVLVVVRLLSAWITIPRRVRAFQAEFAQAKRGLDERGVESLDAHELVDELEHSSERLFQRMAVAPISDFFTQQVYGLLGRLIEAWKLGDPVALRNELLCGETGMESVEPVRSLVRLAEQIRTDTPLRGIFESQHSHVDVWDAIQHDPALESVRHALGEHLASYGDRSLSELKLEARTLQDDPSALVAMLRNYVRGGQDVESMEAHEQRIRRDAERVVREQLKRRPLRHLVFAFVLKRARSGLKTRENVRLTRGRMAGFFRRICRALGERFVNDGLLAERDDVFFLTVDEVFDAVRGASVTRDLQALVCLRRGEYESAADEAAPSRIETRGVVHSRVRDALPDVRPQASGGQLQGIGCSPGRVHAKAMVIETPTPDMTIAGEILVASTTDPGWVFLMVAAGGLVSEKGNVLSHTAIIGRELGIPTVVEVPGAMELLRDGEIVELDGAAGTVTIVEAKES